MNGISQTCARFIVDKVAPFSSETFSADGPAWKQSVSRWIKGIERMGVEGVH